MFDELGVPIIPGGQILYPIGVGTEPTDALAEHMRAPQLRTPTPTTANNQSYYIWVKNRSGVIGGWMIPKEFRTTLEQRAIAEADRRELLGQWTEALPNGGIERVKRSVYWHEVAQANAKILENEVARREIQQLQDDFNRAEQKFNQAYEAYQKTLAAMIIAQKQNATFEDVQQCLGLLRGAIEAGQLISSNDGKSPPRTDGTPQESVPVTIEYTRTTIKTLKGQYDKQNVQIRTDAANLQQLNDALNAKWRQNGAQPPKADPLLVIKP